MDDVGKALNDELRAAHGDVEEVDNLATAISKMGSRALTQTNAIVEALELLARSVLPENHKALQAARRDPTYAADKGDKKSDQQYIKDFFETALEKLVVTYSHSETYSETDGLAAEFLSFDAIVEKEGGRHNPANILAAKRRCQKCIARGAKYARFDTWADRTKYAFIVEGFTAVRSNAYEQRSSGTAVPGGAAGSADTGAGGKGETSEGGNSGKPPPRTPRDRTSLEKNLSAATATKNAFKGIIGDAEGLLEQMQSDPEYAKEKLSYYDDLQKTVSSLKKRRTTRLSLNSSSLWRRQTSARNIRRQTSCLHHAVT